MMLQRLIHSARVNVFESARFYYWVLVVLTSYFLLNRFLQKLSYVYLDVRWTDLKIGEGVLFGLAYVVILISAWFLRKKIPRYVFWCWGGIVLIFLINEFRFAWGNPDYSLMESLTKSQGYYTAKFTMPLLFLGVWGRLKNHKLVSMKFLNGFEKVLLINGFFIIIGFLTGWQIFESYPKSERWGYGGLFKHLTLQNIAYGIFLIRSWSSYSKVKWKTFFFSICLLLMGQKAALLYIFLFVVVVIVDNKYYIFSFFSVMLIFILSTPFWIKYIVSISPFWEKIYKSDGIWSLIFSYRNNLFLNIWNNHESSLFKFIFGGFSRHPHAVEMFPLDMFVYYGFTGLFCVVLLYFRFISSFKFFIPVFVSCLAGGLYAGPISMMLFYLWVYESDSK